MAGASAARAVPSPILPPPPDLVPHLPPAPRAAHWLPPHPLPGPAGPLRLPLPLSGGWALPPSLPPSRASSSSPRSPPPRARRTEPALPPSRGSGPGTAGALRMGSGRTQQAARVAASRAPAGTVASEASLGARRAKRLHLPGQIGVRRVAGTPKARGRAMAAASGGYPPDRTLGEGSKGVEPPHTG
ncbi:uncharacterized protein LOC110569038 [Aotus nancymaae]|uniref:uncharacterized protein LOC110569038 n=1 Tax=Aotus nancymaae TaxID=37293 RepID=UPI0030FE4E2D